MGTHKSMNCKNCGKVFNVLDMGQISAYCPKCEGDPNILSNDWHKFSDKKIG